jgi:predicted metal-dependent hydrolase
MTGQATKKEEVGYAYNFVADIGNRQQITITGNFPVGATVEFMNKELDLVRRVHSRQQAQSALSAAKDKLEVLEERLRLTIEDNARTLTEYGDKHLSVNERDALKRVKESIYQQEIDIESEKLLVERFAKEAA